MALAKINMTRAGLLILFAAAGCTHTAPQRVTYTLAAPSVDTPPSTTPSVTAAPARAPTSVAYSAQTLSVLAARMSLPPAAAPRSTDEIIDDANKSAAQRPATEQYTNAIQEYAFVPGMLYQIYAAPMRITDLALEPGEEIGDTGCGDSVRWKFEKGISVASGQQQQHVRIKPTFPGMTTNFVINTNRRTYLLELHSYETTYMAAVQWRYPQDELNALKAQAKQTAAAERNSVQLPAVHKLRFGYKLIANDKLAWLPTQVFDDGNKTYLVFPEAMLHREAPVLFVVRNDESQLVNYRVKRNWYIVDRLFEHAELRVGQSDPEIVRIIAPGSAEL